MFDNPFVYFIVLMGALGGQTSKQLRRIFIPVIATIYGYLILHSFWCLTFMSMFGVLSLGYGIPGPGDKGSVLGRFYTKIFSTHLLADIFSRGTVGALIALSLIAAPILTGNWGNYVLGALIIITPWVLISWRNLGEFKWELFKFKYMLLKSDVYCYLLTGLGVVIILKG